MRKSERQKEKDGQRERVERERMGETVLLVGGEVGERYGCWTTARIVSSFTRNIVSLVSSITWRLASRNMASTRVHR